MSKSLFRAALLGGIGLTLAACQDTTLRRQAPESAPILQGPAVSGNGTPLDTAFVCVRDRMAERRMAQLAVGVGEVRDFTGKSSINEGATITQGGALMVMSALGKLGRNIRIHERFDPRVGELELIYTDRRQLGDGRNHMVLEGNRLRPVPWVPYMGGSILQSQYFIVGGITEVNWSVQSGGGGARINNAGISARSFTMNIAADLRIVDTRTLVVAHTVSLQKQVVGHEVNLDIFRFFGSRLFDISAGTRNLEPVQLAVRATLELGVLELLSAVSGVTLDGCLNEAVEAGLVSRAYVPPVIPDAPIAPPTPPQPEMMAPTPAPTPRPARRQPVAARTPPAGGEAPAGPVPLQPTGASRTTAPDATQRRPDSASRPPIPSWLEGPSLPSTAPGTLFAPNGNGNGGRNGPAPAAVPVPSNAPVVPPQLQDGNSPSPGARLNILGFLAPPHFRRAVEPGPAAARGTPELG